MPTLKLAGAALVVVFVFLVASFVISPSLATSTPMASPAQTATMVTIISSTVTSTSSTLTSSITSSTELTTLTSLTTISSTMFTYGGGTAIGIPGFPVEGILLGFIAGALMLVLLRRRPQHAVKQ